MVRVGIRNIFSNISLVKNTLRGQKADRIKKKVKDTRKMKTGIRAGRLKAAAARQQARRSLGVK